MCWSDALSIGEDLELLLLLLSSSVGVEARVVCGVDVQTVP
jgi:hypothetical protein